MKKINLIYSDNDLTSFNATHLQSLLTKFFNVVKYDSTQQYDRRNSVAIASMSRQNWPVKLQQQGVKVVVDNLWESPMLTLSKTLMLTSKNWFWYYESLLYKQLGYDTYIPNRRYKKTAFLPMRLKKHHRTKLLEKLTPYLDTMIYSYVEQGIYLSADMPHDLVTKTGNFQRYFNPQWVDDTYYTIVSETRMDGLDTFVTEKTFKPMAFKHPFLICAQQNHLAYIKSLGFETFENLFDESYDTILDPMERLDAIVNNVCNFKLVPYDTQTQEKIEHNYNLFYNQQKVEEGFIKEVVNPILEYAFTT